MHNHHKILKFIRKESTLLSHLEKANEEGEVVNINSYGVSMWNLESENKND